MPAADDLFRPTGDGDEGAERAPAKKKAPVHAVPDTPEPAAPKRASGRVRHDEKMTVYVTSEELLDLEHTRLALRREHGLALDRGRLVREAVALVLADFEDKGHDSALVRRLSEE